MNMNMNMVHIWWAKSGESEEFQLITDPGKIGQIACETWVGYEYLNVLTYVRNVLNEKDEN